MAVIEICAWCEQPTPLKDRTVDKYKSMCNPCAIQANK